MKYSPEYINSMSKKITLDDVKEAIEKQTILEALVVSCSEDLTLDLNIGRDIKGKVKFEDIEYKFDGSAVKPVAAMSKVGRHIKFVPTAIKYENGVYIVDCSRLLAQKQCYENKISKLVPGDILDARIIRVENYGIFCDIGCGIVALLPTNMISVTHIVNPKELLSDLKTLKVVVSEVEENGRIKLSHKELLGTWKEEAAKIEAGTTVCGTVLSVEEYGTFVRLSQNLNGLATPTPELKLKSGDMVSVHINSITENTMKIKLNIISVLDGISEELKFDYYISKGHIDEWVYSDGKKTIKTVFGPKAEDSVVE